ncbi:release factor glutamine methyltransferase [Microterricola gilva]|uniref:peptide chain release factor N(5)-glutamine methyltransferase n=1 Tax=Microterricola gilva TaxID=393267 RepID=A0A4Q8ALA0_9MICO|nr:release factor glutamine methyltransferase [Microterricola gilva]
MHALRASGSVFAEDEAALLLEASAGDAAHLRQLLDRRLAGLPLEQVLGWAEFAGLRVAVAPGVFVPRRRTEFLAELAIDACSADAVVVDLCCGSGAISAAVLASVPTARLWASDVTAESVRCARHNLGDRATVVRGDLFAALPSALRGQIDVLAVNAPYVPSASIALMPPEARVHEPRSALDGGPDGLDVHRRVAADAGGWLRPGGTLFIEASAEQAPASAALFEAVGFATRVERDDSRDATVVVAC